MQPKKSQGPSRATVAGSAVVVCAVLIGAAYFLRDDSQQQPWPVKTPWLDAILARCDEGPTHDLVDGRVRTRCSTDTHPAFLIEVIGSGGKIDSAKMLVPMRGSTNDILDRILFGLEMFGAIADARPESFLSKEYLDAVGLSKTGVVFQGRLYSTGPIPEVGLIFAVTPPDQDSASAN
jgi:hypothetical protein